MGRMLVTLICLTSSVFLVLQGVRLLADESWSWIITAGYGMAILLEAFALWDIRAGK